jgi:hypothetical protein
MNFPDEILNLIFSFRENHPTAILIKNAVIETKNNFHRDIFYFTKAYFNHRNRYQHCNNEYKIKNRCPYGGYASHHTTYEYVLNAMEYEEYIRFDNFYHNAILNEPDYFNF